MANGQAPALKAASCTTGAPRGMEASSQGQRGKPDASQSQAQPRLGRVSGTRETHESSRSGSEAQRPLGDMTAVLVRGLWQPGQARAGGCDDAGQRTQNFKTGHWSGARARGKVARILVSVTEKNQHYNPLSGFQFNWKNLNSIPALYSATSNA